MKTIRRSIFETNSSSSHSITIADTGGLKNSLECEKGIIKIRCGEYGWGVEYYYDTYTKLSYLVTYLFGNKAGDDTEIDWAKFNSPDNPKKPLWDKLQDVVFEFTGCKIEVIPNKESIFKFGYIDHQSEDVAYNILTDTKGRIKRFLFNPSSELKIDHDNY